jgi:protein-S-isoprenylcysteine O-methyltransferase Ste14
MQISMIDIIIFVALSMLVIIVSRRNVFRVNSHGFYRLLSWECIVLLFSANYKFWIVDPSGIYQILSWILLILSGTVVIAGVLKIKKASGARSSREGEELYEFEKTTELIDSGIFRYIRHPLYASLLYLTWGIFFKRPALLLLIVAILSSAFLYITARFDEKECTSFFGDMYKGYMTRSKMFVPFVF